MQSDTPPGAIIALQRDGALWAAELQQNSSKDWRPRATLAAVLADTRHVLGNRPFTLKVKPGTELTADDVLTIVAASGLVDFSGCRMPNIDLSFETHHFVNDPPFRGADLLNVEFRECDLSGAQLQEAWLKRLEGANLSNAQLQGAYLDGANLKRSNLSGAVLRGAYLQRAQLQHANLSRSQLQGAVLDDAELQGADLSDAQLQGAQLKGARLLSMEVFDAPAKPTSQWFNIAVFDRTAIERAQIVDFVVDSSRASALGTAEGFGQARELYMLLKNNFESIGRYEDAAWAYIEEKHMERLKLGCLVNLRHPWRTRRPLAAWLLRWTYELTTGYGERPGRMLFWSLVTILLFALMFAFVVPIGEVAPGAAGHPTRVEGWRNMLNALTHSLSTFATIGFNTLEPLGTGARLLTAMEAALGIGCFALFIFILGNRIRRS